MRNILMRSDRRAFTIVEVIIVVFVIAILAAVVIVGYNAVRERADSSAMAATVKDIRDTLRLWSAKNDGKAPATLTEAGVITNQQYTIEYMPFDGNREYCIAAVKDTKGAYINTATGTTPMSGRCSDPSAIAITGTPLVYTTTNGATQNLSSPLTGTPSFTMYIAYDSINTTSAFSTLASLGPSSASARAQMDTNNTGMNSMRYRLDTSATTNMSAAQSGARSTGRHVGWLQVSNNMTTRSFGYDQANPASSTSMLPGTGWTFTTATLQNGNSSIQPLALLVYAEAHDEATRARVLQWLSTMHSVPLTF